MLLRYTPSRYHAYRAGVEKTSEVADFTFGTWEDKVEKAMDHELRNGRPVSVRASRQVIACMLL